MERWDEEQGVLLMSGILLLVMYLVDAVYVCVWICCHMLQSVCDCGSVVCLVSVPSATKCMWVCFLLHNSVVVVVVLHNTT